MDGNLAVNRDELYTYADYLTWDDNQRWELIYGKAYLMAAPGTAHQRIVGALFYRMYPHFEGKPCEVFLSPYDVRLFPQEEDSDYIVLQPDISIVCNPDQIDERGCKGAPTLVVEILSPSSSSKDFTVKMDLYREAGVKEYWIADPHSGEIHVYQLQKREDNRTTYKKDDALVSFVFPELSIPLGEIFS